MNCQTHEQNGNRLPHPKDLSLPFFAYGVFKPGELAFLQIKEFVSLCFEGTVDGQLKIRDGLPIAAIELPGRLDGVLIQFRTECQLAAYQRISDLEPEKQYRWGTADAGGQIVNLLVGISPDKGSHALEEAWDGRKDPLFTDALEVVEETLKQNRGEKSPTDLKPLFRLEMAYLLLWSSIERYASLRYHLRDKATEKVLRIASEPAFVAALRKFAPSDKRSVQRADDPKKKSILDPEKPLEAMKYYYQVRSNLVHRGKGALGDHDRLAKSLGELLSIFRYTLKAAFDDSKFEGEH